MFPTFSLQARRIGPPARRIHRTDALKYSAGFNSLDRRLAVAPTMDGTG
jgi:hypothetical protein